MEEECTSAQNDHWLLRLLTALSELLKEKCNFLPSDVKFKINWPLIRISMPKGHLIPLGKDNLAFLYMRWPDILNRIDITQDKMILRLFWEGLIIAGIRNLTLKSLARLYKPFHLQNRKSPLIRMLNKRKIQRMPRKKRRKKKRQSKREKPYHQPNRRHQWKTPIIGHIGK